MSLKDKWKNFGKGMGTSFSSFGTTVVKTVRRCVESEDEKQKRAYEPSLKESWKNVGRNFGKTGKAFVKAVEGTADKIINEEEN